MDLSCLPLMGQIDESRSRVHHPARPVDRLLFDPLGYSQRLSNRHDRRVLLLDYFRLILASEGWVNAKSVHLLHQYAEIVADELGVGLVSHRSFVLGSESVAELPFNHGD